MTKQELTRSVAEQVGMPQSQVADVVDRTFHGIGEVLRHEGRIELRDFGVFEVRRRRARWARNPRTGERIPVPECLVVTFKPGRELRRQAERYGQPPDPSVGPAGGTVEG